LELGGVRALKGSWGMSAQRRSLGDLLRRHRLAAGLSQGDLADLAGLSRRGVSDIERGIIQAPHHDTIARLADALALADAERHALQAAARGQVIPPGVMPAPTWRLATSAAPPFVGRQEEMALLERHLAGETVPLLLFSGEPGIGKSRLLAEAATLASAQGWRVVAGGCTRRSGQAPYEPVVSALARAVRTTPPARLRLDLQGCSWLVRLLPELLETQLVPAPSWTLPPEQERRLMFDTVARYLANVAGPAGTLLVLDDLQWADGDALALVEALVAAAAEAGRSAPVRLLGAYRSTEVGAADPMGLLLADLMRAGTVARRQLSLLAPVEAAALLAHLWPARQEVEEIGAEAAARAETLRRAGGLPFFLVSSASALQERTGGVDPASHAAGAHGADGREGELAAFASGGGQVPASVAESVQARVAVLPETARRLAEVAAVAGRIISAPLLLAVTARPEEETLDALDALVNVGLLAEDEKQTYRFTHDLIREVVEGGLGSQRRRTLHRRLAEELERRPTGAQQIYAAEIATHFLAAGEQAQALPYMLLAGDQAESVYAHTEAEGHYRTALELARELGDRARETEALEKLARALHILRRFNDALEIAAQGVAVCGALGDVEAEARMVWLVGWIHHFGRGTPAEGLTELAPLIADLRRRGASPSAVIHLQLMLILLWEDTGKDETFGGVAHEAFATTEQVLAVARTAQDATVLRDALVLVHRIAGHMGNYEAEFLALEEVVTLDAPTGDAWRQTETATMAVYAVKMLAYIYTIRGGFAESRPLYERAVGEAMRDGNPHDLVSAQRARGWQLFLSGDWTHARSDFEQAEEISRKSKGVSDQALSLLFQLNVAEGRAEEESAELLEILAHSAKSHQYNLACDVQCALAERDLLSDSVESARERLQPLLDEHLTDLDEDNLIVVLIYFAWVNLELGDSARAEEQLAESQSRIAATGWQLWQVDALRVEALIRIAQRRWPEAEVALDEALERARAMPYPYAEAKALWVYGQLETARGDPVAARERFVQALAICDRLGEGLYRTRIACELSALAHI
jgi:transcriptional regulator with XRE-family HTH domain/tetratricopeptide (TPR) repeat protein